jgi:hypothetical protein
MDVRGPRRGETVGDPRRRRPARTRAIRAASRSAAIIEAGLALSFPAMS